MDRIELYKMDYISLYDLTYAEFQEAVRLGLVPPFEKARYELRFSWFELLTELDRVFRFTKLVDFIARKLK